MRNGVVMDQLILFNKPNKNVRSENMMDYIIRQTNTPICAAHPSAVQRRRGRQTESFLFLGFGSDHILVYNESDNIGCKCKDPKPIAESGQQASTSTL